MARRVSHHPLFPPALSLIDCAGMRAALASLCQLIHYVLYDADEVLRVARDIRRAAARLVRAEAANARVVLKFEMLADPRWRGRVLRELGGARALARWRRIMEARFPSGELCHPLTKPHPSPAQRAARRANLAKARAALRKSFTHKGGPHPLVFKDCVKMDNAGQFSLAPLIRLKRESVTLPPAYRAPPACRAPAPKPRAAISVTLSRVKPIALWPIEFEAAIAARPPRGAGLGAIAVFKNDVAPQRALPPPLFFDSG